ncbi:hypothetical protein M0805_005069 [Coniferiporia weirii]|nr:hypothetical protein M0805_005069 [Coniferiporia weirii]
MAELGFAPKRERSLTPVLAEPTTSGAYRIAEMPLECKKASPGYLMARKKWVKDETNKLSTKGLKVKKFFVRDDGLVLDWESPIPIWPDTLLPVSDSVEFPCVISSPVPAVYDARAEETSDALLGEGSDRKALELEDMAVEFLKKYAETFDTNRASLADAYTSDAAFSYCVHDIVSPNSLAAAFTNPGEVQRFAPRNGSRNLSNIQTSKNLHRGRAEIVTALLSLGAHKFCSRSPTDVHWNVLALSSGSKPSVILTSFGYLTEERAGREHRLSFDQCFILRTPEGFGDDDIQGLDDGLWSMVAVSHQLTLRDMSLIPSAR